MTYVQQLRRMSDTKLCSEHIYWVDLRNDAGPLGMVKHTASARARAAWGEIVRRAMIHVSFKEKEAVVRRLMG